LHVEGRSDFLVNTAALSREQFREVVSTADRNSGGYRTEIVFVDAFDDRRPPDGTV
jgi:hypothetical protein